MMEKSTGCSGRTAFIGVPALLLAIIVSIISWSACPPALAESASAQKVVLTVPARALTFVPFHFGKELGFYEKEGIDLQIVRMKTNLVSAGLISGEVKFGVPLSNFVRAAAAGMPVKLVMTVESRIVYDLVAAKDITSLKQFKGQPIGITAKHGNLHLTAIAVLKANGVSEKDVTFISYPGLREVMQALEAGAIKGAVFPPPFNIKASKKGFPTLAHGAEYYNGAAQGLATSDRYLTEDRPAVVAMIRASLRTLRFIKANPAKTTAFIESNLKVNPELAKTLYGFLAQQISEDGEITTQWVRDRLDELIALRGTPKVLDPEKMLDLGPLREARASLKQ